MSGAGGEGGLTLMWVLREAQQQRLEAQQQAEEEER